MVVMVVVGPRRPLQVDDVIDPELSSSPMPEISIGELVTCLSTRDLRRAARRRLSRKVSAFLLKSREVDRLEGRQVCLVHTVQSWKSLREECEDLREDAAEEGWEGGGEGEGEGWWEEGWRREGTNYY